MSTTDLNRILLVEDDPDIQEIARIVLESIGGYTVRICGDGAEAVEVAPHFAPDLILMDVMMPNMDGPTAFAALRALDSTRHIPVIFMTAKIQSQDRSRYLELGALGVVAKPFDPMTLSESLQELWTRHLDSKNVD